MTTLLELRENLKNFYNKYEIYITPVLKFLLALISLVIVNLNVGYMSKLANPVIILVVALMCSFLPASFIILISSVYIVMNFYALSLECAVVALCLFLVLFFGLRISLRALKSTAYICPECCETFIPNPQDALLVYIKQGEYPLTCPTCDFHGICQSKK